MRSKFALAIAAIVLLCGFNQDGQYDEVPEHLRKWFKGVRSPHGVPCCDIADGHPTDEDIRKDAYYVPDPLNAGIQTRQGGGLGHVFPKIADMPRFFDQMQQCLPYPPAFPEIHAMFLAI